MNRRILNFEKFLLESQKISVLNEETDINSISRAELTKIVDTDMRTYLKKAMWNKSIEVFYGKDYTGNPTEDKRELYAGNVIWSTNHSKITMGDFFKDAWAETDQFCDRVVEYVETGEISDTWTTIGKGALYSLLGAAAVVAVLGTGGFALGLLGASTSFTAAVTSSFGMSLASSGALLGLYKYIDDSLDEEQLKKLSPELVNIVNMLRDKDNTINSFKAAIEDHSDFEADWGLDSYLPAVQGMPGWDKSAWSKKGAENIGYSFTYWISYYAYKFLQVKFSASAALAIQEQQSKPAQTTEPKKSTEIEQQPKTTSVPQPSPDTTPITQPEEISGVKGTMPQEDIIIDDDVLSKYDV
jgi:hypothetical protein